MRLVRTGRTPREMREVYDTKRCEGCGGALASPHVLIGHLPCSCDSGLSAGGHRSLRCLDCNTVHLEPPCDRPDRGHGSLYG